MKVLIFGLPGSGKTTLAQELKNIFGDRAEWINADAVRTECDDWDFSKKGRERQNQRMRILADQAVEKGKIAITDFICPLESTRTAFYADYEVFVDTIKKGRFDDTNKMFERPKYDNPDCIIPHTIVKHKRGDLDARIVAATIEEIIKST
jgi:adenylylsulfate kinase